VRVIEARDLAGVSLDPSVTVTLGEAEKKTTVKKQTNNPEWDEVRVFFNFTNSMMLNLKMFVMTN